MSSATRGSPVPVTAADNTNAPVHLTTFLGAKGWHRNFYEGMHMRIRTTLLLAFGLIVLSALPAGAQEAQASVSVVHGIPATPVDVYVNDALTLEDFEPGDVAGPLSLPAGTYQVDVRAAGADAGAAPVISASAPVAAGANATLVAHLNAEGAPTITPFANDTSGIGGGRGRLTVRHTAAAPAVDILVGGTAAITGLTNPDEASAVLDAGTVSAAVALAGTTEPVIGPADVPVRDGVQTIVYAIGSASEGTLGVVVQNVSHTPTGVASGSGGEAAPAAFPLWAVALMAAAGLGSVVSAVRVARVRS